MSTRQGLKFPRINRVREEINQLGEMVVGYEGVSSLQEPELRGVSRENGTEGADLAGAKTFGFEYLIGRLDAVVVLICTEHSDPQFVDVVVGGEGMAVGINKRQI